SGYLPRNFRGCVGNNRCAFGCPADAKQAMHLNYLPQAVEAGARVISGARVQRVTFQGKRATGVVAHTRDEDGRRRKLEVRAKKVVVAAGTFYTPLLLRASGVRHRNLGRRLTLHPAIKISALFPGEDFYSGPGVPQSYFVDEFQEQGIMMEGAHVPPDMTATSLPTRPSEHKALMERSRELALFGFLVSDEPSGTVHRGLAGRPFIRYDLSRGDYKKMIFGLKKLAQLFVAAG
ncbi:MAG TPA: GMC oxidoreductase, partial [Deltaproteobacteria bacterium]|nr:GMC oxidoreductase [Deltaproteobacteria bacterium]